MVGGLVVGGRFLSAESWASDGSHELFVSKSLASGPPGPSQPVTARAVAHLFPQLRPQIAEADGNRTRPPSLPGALVLKIRDVGAAWSSQCRFVLVGADPWAPFVQVVPVRVDLCLHGLARKSGQRFDPHVGSVAERRPSASLGKRVPVLRCVSLLLRA